MKFHTERPPVSGECIFETSIPSDLAHKTPLCVRLCRELQDRGLLLDSEWEKYEICFEEALKNAILHGNGQDASLFITVRLFEDGDHWGLTVADQGSGFAGEDLPDETDPWSESGRGIQLMQQVVDRLEYFDSGRTLLISRRIVESESSRPEPSAPPGVDDSTPPVSANEGLTLTVIRPKDVTDEQVETTVEKALEVAESAGSSVLLLDLSKLAFISSYAIGQLVSLSKACQRQSVELRLSGMCDDLQEMFSSMNLDSVFAIYDTPNAAARG